MSIIFQDKIGETTHIVDCIRFRSFLQKQLNDFHVTAIGSAHESCPAVLYTQYSTQHIKDVMSLCCLATTERGAFLEVKWSII